VLIRRRPAPEHGAVGIPGIEKLCGAADPDVTVRRASSFEEKGAASDRDTLDEDLPQDGSVASGLSASRFPLFLFFFPIARVRGGAALY
jgi:hypothetical protein